MCKRGWKWLITLLVLILAILSACMAGADAEGNKLEPRFTITPKPAVPMRGSSSGITITCKQGTNTVNPNDCVTGVEYTFSWNYSQPYYQFRYILGILDDPSQPFTADTMTKTDEYSDTTQTLKYTFYEPGDYVLFILASNNKNNISEQLFIRVAEGSAANALTNAVNTAKQACLEPGDQFATALNINDYLANNVAYDSTYTYYSAYDALVRHSSVCNGYSRAYELIAKACGLECVRVLGDSKGEGHAWNAVKIDGRWYHVDPTWDDSGSEHSRHIYMGLDDDLISIDHTITGYSVPNFRPICNSLEDNYFIHTGKWTDLAKDALPAVRTVLSNAATTGTRTFSIPFETAYLERISTDYGGQYYSPSDDVLQINGHLVAYGLNNDPAIRGSGTENPIQGSYTYSHADRALKGSLKIPQVSIPENQFFVTYPADGNTVYSVPVDSPFSILVQAEGASDVRFIYGDGRISSVLGNDLSFWTQHDPASFTLSNSYPVSTDAYGGAPYTLYVEACYDPDPSAENAVWVESNRISIHCLPRGTAAEPIVRFDVFSYNTYSRIEIAQGTSLDFTVVQTEGTEEYLIELLQENGTEVFHLSLSAADMKAIPSSSDIGKHISLPTSSLIADQTGAHFNYRLRITCAREGYDSSSVLYPVLVHENTNSSTSGITLSSDANEAIIGESILITATAPGAKFIALKQIYPDKTETILQGPFPGDALVFSCQSYYPDSFTYTAVAWDGDDTSEEPARTSEPLTVEFTARGTLTAEVTVDPCVLSAGDTLAVTMGEAKDNPDSSAVISGAQYTVCLETEDGSRLVYSEKKDEPITAGISAATLASNTIYRLRAKVEAPGYMPFECEYPILRDDYTGSITISLAGVDADPDNTNHYTVNTNQAYTLTLENPDSFSSVEILSGNSWITCDDPSEISLTWSLPVTDSPLMLRAVKPSGGYAYSGLVYITVVCGHTNTNETSIWFDPDTEVFLEGPTVTEIPDNNLVHSVSGYMIECYYCQDCDTYIQIPGKTPFQINSYTEDHDYDENLTVRTCTKCGHVSTCTEHVRPDTPGYEFSGETTYYPAGVTDLVHVITGTGYTYEACTNCGYIISRSEITTLSITEPHNYMDGVCNLCHYTCEHTSRLENRERILGAEPTYTYEGIDQSIHRKYPVYAEYERCAACYTLLVDETPDYVTNQYDYTEEPHTDENNDDLCDICGFDMTQTWSWAVENGDTLVLSDTQGTGEIHSFTSAGDAPWHKQGYTNAIKKVIVEASISSLGENVLAGFSNTLRVDFERTAAPVLDSGLFGSGKAVCRYYTKSGTWPDMTNVSYPFDADKVQWVYLPVRLTTSGAVIRFRERKWFLQENAGNFNSAFTEIAADAAKEYTYENCVAYLEELPVDSKDRAVYENRGVHTMIIFLDGCTGEYQLNLAGGIDTDLDIDVEAPGLELTINKPAGNTAGAVSILDIQRGKVICNWNVDDLRLRGNNSIYTADVVINGNVNNLSYYNATSDQPFAGTLTVNGTIIRGYEYGRNQLSVPGIMADGSPVELGSIANRSFSGINQTDQVITYNQEKELYELSINGETSTVGDLDIHMFDLVYMFYPDRVEFSVSPKAGSGLGSMNARVDNILDDDHNPRFTTDDICWGDSTTVYFLDTGSVPYALNGTTKDGTPVGIKALYLQNCNVTVNCPVDFLKTWQYSRDLGPVNLTINNVVDSAEVMFFRPGGRIRLGSGGAIRSGVWDRGYHGYWDIGSAAGPCDYALNGTLTVLSAKQGNSLKSIPAGDRAVTLAANLTSGYVAAMDIKDSTLTGNESTALNAYITEGQQVYKVFDVSISKFSEDEDGNRSFLEPLDHLAHNVSVTVENTSGIVAQVVRLHDNAPQGSEPDIAITALGTPGSADRLTFDTDTFSTYAIITGMASPSAEPVYSWTDEGDSLTITASWTPAGASEITESGIITSEVILAPTCEADGEILYTATFTNPAFTTQTRLEPIPHGHDFENAEITYVWNDNYTSVSACLVCKNNPAHLSDPVAETTTIQSETNIAATCTSEGEITYTAVFENTAYGSAAITVTVPVQPHTLTEVAATEATCTAEGHNAFWECSVCRQQFRDSTGTTPVDESDSISVNPNAHLWGEPTYTWSEDYSSVTAVRTCIHNPEHTESVTASATVTASMPVSCTANGSTTYTSAAFNNSAFAVQTTTVELEALGHDPVAHPAQAATCTAVGNSAYWSCSRCDLFFSDEQCTTAIAQDSWITAKADHDLSAHEAISANCTTPGNTAYWECSTCGTHFKNQNGSEAYEDNEWILPVIQDAHSWNTPTYEWAEDNSSVTATRTCNNGDHPESQTVQTSSSVFLSATCETKGKTTYTASFEGSVFANQTKTVEDIDALGHDYSFTFTWASDNSQLTATKECSRDSSHNYTETVYTTYAQTKAAACGVKGETTYTATFTSGAFETQTKTLANIPALEHSWNAPTYEWAADNSSVTAARTCNNGDHPETETAATSASVSVPAACETKGQTTYSVTFTNPAFTVDPKTVEDIPALGHAWGTPEYEWADNNSMVTATRTCTRNTGHTETETANTTSAQTKAAACGVKGETTYTAAFANSAFGTQTKVLANIPALTHAWNDPTYAWAADNSSVTATRTCKNGDHPETETAAATSSITKASTCTETGIRTYTSAAFKNGAFTVQAKETDIPTLGHDYGAPSYTWADDNSKVTAARTCSRNDGHAETETVKTTSAVTKDAACEAAGETSYTAAFTNGAFTAQSKVLANIPALGHNWNAPTYEWAADNSTVTAARTCSRNDAHTETETVKTTSAVTIKAACEEAGEITYTAEFSKAGFSTQTKKAETDPKGHRPVKDPAVAPTYTEEGRTEGSHCGDCGNILVEQKVLPKLVAEIPETPDTPQTPDTPPTPDTPETLETPASDPPATEPDTPVSEPDPPAAEPDTPEAKIRAFVSRCYQLILNREADEGGLTGWSDALIGKTATAAQIIDGFVRSDEFTNRNLPDSDKVDILYRTMLNREADAGGKAGWVDALSKGYTLQNIIDGFCGSDEFKALSQEYGIEPGSVGAAAPTDTSTPRGKIEAFVKRCYQLILNRQADDGGLKGWSDALEGKTAAAAQIIDGFVRSPEYINRNLTNEQSVTILYKTMLDRDPDEGGKAGWVDALGKGYTLQHIINGFCGSAEFTKICSDYGIEAGSVAVPTQSAAAPEAQDLPDERIGNAVSMDEAGITVVNGYEPAEVEAFVKHAYRAALGREADEAGLAGWTEQIVSGAVTPKAFLRTLLFSDEQVARQLNNEQYIDMLYHLYLNRGADEAAAGWIEVLVTAGHDEVIRGFENSAEFRVLCSRYGIIPGSVK